MELGPSISTKINGFIEDRAPQTNKETLPVYKGQVGEEFV
jgi:hypothetical protein